jgi:two-component system, sensor histidine kinase PdtaS
VYDGVDEALEGGALRILDYDQWYQRAAHLKGLEVVQLWLDEEEQALADGYNGLRITGNVTFLKPEDWPTFVDYEQAVTTAFSGRRIVALCSYAEAGCDGSQAREVVRAHHCAFEHAGGTWQVAVPHGLAGRHP